MIRLNLLGIGNMNSLFNWLLDLNPIVMSLRYLSGLHGFNEVSRQVPIGLPVREKPQSRLCDRLVLLCVYGVRLHHGHVPEGVWISLFYSIYKGIIIQSVEVY
ncbi:hypothetical protein M3650_20020 [Paenibacillus sp. MER TA 81-3]|uniref:hypothetical protein n=1 Tax=Paenibacillus sp. MER TA 81-3 TaxID=2939573 RepID=UPI002040E463|nr:hypothetical protein [Paenibacillus sp. MER TA 81-3]MCM3340856.1 hypothetical protein [Paenibacillus sp. MER TA 81-3]